jgi:Phasin protein
MKAAQFGNEESIHRAFERTPLGAMVQSGTVLSETAKHLFEEWTDIGRGRLERGFGRIEAFLQCRTPQDFAALQGELLRDNMETVFSYARKAREHSTRLANEAEQRFGSLAEVMISRPGEVLGEGQTTRHRPSHRAARRKSAHKRSAPATRATAKRRRPGH